MAIQATPPVQLDPSMDNGHQLAFINQNFQSIANTLQQNSFIILKLGTVTGNSITDGNADYITIAHGQAITPIPLVYFSGGTFYYPLPFADNQSYAAGGGGVKNLTYHYCYTDSTNLYITSINASGITRGPYSFKYYLLQQTAN